MGNTPQPRQFKSIAKAIEAEGCRRIHRRPRYGRLFKRYLNQGVI